jgi:hypothetical protein
VEEHIENQQQVLQLLKDNLTMAQNRMKQQADQHRSERSFGVRDWAFLRLQPYKQMSLKKSKKDNKLYPKYYGPIRCCKRLVCGIQIGASCIFVSTPSFPCFMLKESYR